MRELFIGLMSGTSMDGIDAVLATFGTQSVQLLAVHEERYPEEVRQRLEAAVRHPDGCGVDELGQLDTAVGACFRDAALALIAAADADAGSIRAIGSHGQTLRHGPGASFPYTLQIGNPAIIAAGTGVDTVADFRRADLALGGQAAPLVPRFHDWLFRAAGEHRAIVNIGGIANVTVLPAGAGPVTGFDTGPGNTLLDAWIRRTLDLPFDTGGGWGKGGTLNDDLLCRLLADPWFSAPPPKSTGPEYFNLDWLLPFGVETGDPRGVQATLAEFTAASIAQAIVAWAAPVSRVFVCGGGARNQDLMRRLSLRLGDVGVESTAAIGLDPDWVEACAFAWLAKRRIERLPGNVPSVTGASREAVLGAVYAGASRQPSRKT